MDEKSAGIKHTNMTATPPDAVTGRAAPGTTAPVASSGAGR